MLDLMFFLLLGHYLGDFALQSDKMARYKGESPSILSLHVLIYTSTLTLLLAYGLSFRGDDSFMSLTTLLAVVAVGAIHWIQDLIKARKFDGSKQAYYVDQAIHVTILLLIRIYVYGG